MYILQYLLISVYLICNHVFAIPPSEKSYAASTAQLLDLLDVEDKLVENLNGYVEKLKKKLLLVENSLETMKAANKLMNEDYEEYLGNPINSFSLMLRLHRDWSKWVHYTSYPNKEELVHIEKAHRMRKQLPTARDLEQACHGIDDLVDFYDLNPADLAAGTLAGNVQPETALSAQDCYALAEFCVGDHKDDRAVDYFIASLAKIDTKEEDKLADLYDFRRFSVQSSWAALLIKNKRTADAFNLIRQKPKGSPQGFLGYYFHRLMAAKLSCSAEYQRPSHLHCHYNTTATPFLRIAPIKVEVLSLDPYLVVYHDVVYESEINWFLNVSEFSSSLVSYGLKSSIRSSKDAETTSLKGKVFDAITTRATDMTGLSMDNSDDLALINYGLGGHYDMHFDFFNETDEFRLIRGDRIATIIFYLGDVELGGDTVFPYMKVKVSPKKGSAVMWYNLHNSGDVNTRTAHSACPVIVGSKYVLTKWINEVPQAFATPCMKDAYRNSGDDIQESVFGLN